METTRQLIADKRLNINAKRGEGYGTSFKNGCEAGDFEVGRIGLRF